MPSLNTSAGGGGGGVTSTPSVAAAAIVAQYAEKFLPFGQPQTGDESPSNATPSAAVANFASPNIVERPNIAVRPNASGAQLDDECELFGRQVASDLRSLNARSRLVARKRISDALMDIMLAESEL